jgi:hypothetical protein
VCRENVKACLLFDMWNARSSITGDAEARRVLCLVEDPGRREDL